MNKRYFLIFSIVNCLSFLFTVAMDNADNNLRLRKKEDTPQAMEMHLDNMEETRWHSFKESCKEECTDCCKKAGPVCLVCGIAC